MRVPLLVSALLMMTATRAESLEAVRSIPGYVCMQLNLSDAALVSPQTDNPIYDQPSPSARKVASAANMMIVEDKPAISGFRKVLRFSGETGWMDARYLRPWTDRYAPEARCVPSMMSNGKPGFGTGRYP